MEVESGSVEEVVRWERCLPSVTALRVLLVEPDDSTRHVISALLRKCSYKVKSVSDGLGAWEELQEKPCSVDLILTEEDLPSISGFTLLTLVMEHDVCKKIPVIIMSWQDSISTVLKCMLKGAADFLIKPVRKNELKNLWQHVWRRHISNAGNEEERSKIEAIPGKTAGSSRSSDCIMTKHEEEEGINTNMVAKDPDSIEKCVNMDENSGLSKGKFRLKTLSNASSNSSTLRVVDDCGTAMKRAKHEDSEQSEHNKEKKDNDVFEFQDRDDLSLELPPDAIDLIGKIGPCKHRHDISSLTAAPNDSACGPQLELSLQRENPSSSVTNGRAEGRLLNHSHQSAFSRYSSGDRFALPTPTPALENSEMEVAVTASNGSNQGHNHYLQSSSDRKDDKSAMVCELSEQATPRSSSALLQLEGRLDKSSDCAQALQTTAWSKHAPGMHSSKFLLNSSGSSMLQKARGDNVTAETSVDMHQSEDMQNKEDHGSSAHGSLLSSGLCMDVESSYENTSDRNTDTGNQSALAPVSGPRKMDSLRSSQREAALIKFRLKRKERCFVKKVRYQSRKQLADQRPRVKGQFVRHIQTEAQPSDANSQLMRN